MRVKTSVVGRQFGLDWLRIGAFGLMILYHIGMFFAPWHWYVTTAHPIALLQWPMLAINPWRLSLLFLISGVASRSLLAETAEPTRFALKRSVRLLIPLGAGIVLFVAPQPWFQLRDQTGYSQSFYQFWRSDYFEFGRSRGFTLPTYSHLWFIAYLWVYTIFLAGLAALPSIVRAKLNGAFVRCFRGWRLFVLPVLWLVGCRILLFPKFGENFGFVDDLYSHAVYGFAFFFGVGLGRSRPLWDNILSNWKSAIGIAVLACLIVLYLQRFTSETAVFIMASAVARAVLVWGIIIGLLGFAQSCLHYDGPIRRYLNEAIFPYYIVHQTIIIAAGFYLKHAQVGPVAEFVGIVFATIGGCAVTFEVARRVSWLRPLFGLRVPNDHSHAQRLKQHAMVDNG